MEIYRIYYFHIAELLERLADLAETDAKKAFTMYQKFVDFTETM